MLLKALFRDLNNQETRKDYLYHFAKNLPGEFGFAARKYILQNRFSRIGSSVKIHAGFRVVNIHKLKIGDYVHLGVDNYIQAGGGVTICDFTMLGPGVKIWSQNHIYDNIHTPLKDSGYEYKEVIIGNNCWIGANVFIMPGVVLEDGCVVMAGSVVSAKIWPKFSIIGGNPARKVGTRGEFRKQ
jgi:acetyltransferase-like isoleucine patch superfamily enzyme